MKVRRKNKKKSVHPFSFFGPKVLRRKEEEEDFLASCSVGWCLGGGMFDVVP